MDEAQLPLRDGIATWLRDQGHFATVEPTDERFGEVYFRERGLKFIVRTDEDDPHFLFVLLFAELPDDLDDELVARRAAAKAEESTKVVKVLIRWEHHDFIISAEQYVAEPGGAAIFWRTVSTLAGTFDEMYQHFADEAEKAALERIRL